MNHSFARRALVSIGAIPLVMAMPSTAEAASGDLASEFGSCGIGGVNAGDLGYSTRSVVDDDGATYIAGAVADETGKSMMAVARFLPSGALDTDWAGGGVIIDAGDTSSVATSLALVPTPGGDALVVGGEADQMGVLFRLGPDGSVDEGFGDGGLLYLDEAGANRVVDLDDAPDGGVVGVLQVSSGTYLALIFKLTAGGDLDSTFHGDGYAEPSVHAQALSVLGDKVVIAGGASTSYVADATVRVHRMTMTGGSDGTFNGGNPASVVVNTASTSERGVVRDIVLNGDAILLAGAHETVAPTESNVLLVQFTSTGQPDATFGGGDGYVISDFVATESAAAVAIDDADRIVVAGTGFPPVHPFAARYSGSGVIDESFGAEGVAPLLVDVGAFAHGMGIGPDGLIRIGASVDDGIFAVFAVQPDDAGQSAYVLDGHAGLHPMSIGDVPRIPCSFNAPYFGSDVARDVDLVPGQEHGYVLDENGGLHPFSPGFNFYTPPPPAAQGPYFGFDIAREFVFANDEGGYILDGWGGLHPFRIGSGDLPEVASGGPYFGFDIARDVVLLPTGTGGYVLDGWGGLHPFAIGSNTAPPAITNTPYFDGYDIAREVVLLPDGTGGYVLDGHGGIHRFSIGAAPLPGVATAAPYFGFDIARDLVLYEGGAYLLDGYGGVHRVSLGGGPLPPAKIGGPYFGFDIARALVLVPDPNLTTGASRAATPRRSDATTIADVDLSGAPTFPRLRGS